MYLKYRLIIRLIEEKIFRINNYRYVDIYYKLFLETKKFLYYIFTKTWFDSIIITIKINISIL